MDLQPRWFSRFSDLPADAWTALTAALPTPILEADWLAHLEDSGSISPDTGWTPRHLTLWDGEQLVAAAPLWLKDHSWGEFVYDFGFAQAAGQMGRSWYPKLVGMSPATPSTGYRFLTAPGYDRAELVAQLLDIIEAWCRDSGVASLQFNFAEADFRAELEAAGFLAWTHQHYAFRQPAGTTFDDYLARFDKNQRRNIKREVQSLADQGLSIRLVTGEEAPDHWFALMGELYDRTNDKFGPWAAKFLEPAFFSGLEKIRRHFVLAAAFEGDSAEPFALSFLLKKGQKLIGRYWGTRVEYPELYFNLCYYAPIRWALENGYTEFDPGAGSSLKIRRGFVAEPNWSLHKFFDRSLERLFRHFLPQVNAQEEGQIAQLNAGLPFKQ